MAPKRITSTRARKEVWQTQFLSTLASTANIAEAARAAGVERSTVYRARRDDETFAAAWGVALEEATDALELEARRRALGEVRSYKFDRHGQPLVHPETGEAYYERVASDLLLVTLLKAHRPEKFKERQELSGPGNAPLHPTALDLGKLTADELRLLLDLQAKAAGGEAAST